MTSQPSIKHINNQQGFTLIEIIAVLVLLGILAAVAVPKYMDLTTTARQKAAQGQIAEVKGRLSAALNSYMLENNGNKPTDGAALVGYVNTKVAGSCPTTAAADVTNGDFVFSCTGTSGATNVLITVTQVQGTALTTNNTATYYY